MTIARPSRWTFRPPHPSLAPESRGFHVRRESLPGPCPQVPPADLCLAHNLMVLLEENLLKVERIDNAAERKRKDGRKEQAEKNGANYVAIALQRFTVRTLKFIRWLRNFVYRATSWEAALARLRHVYATF